MICAKVLRLRSPHQLATRRVGTVLVGRAAPQGIAAGSPIIRASKLTDLATAVKRADVIVILVAHNKFRSLDRGAVASKVVVDVVGLLTMMMLDEA